MQMTSEDREALLARLKPLVNRGDYRSALKLTTAAFKRFPGDFTARYQHAKILGDWADELPPARQTKLKKQAVALLKPLLRALRGRPVDERFGLCLNYYYQSRNWRGMYAFGRRFASTNRQKSLYGQSLGATLLAADLRRDGRLASSRSWAEKAVRAWSKYDFAKETYYFPHYSFAKALALAGDPKSALARLKTAARLGRRRLDDWEFADVRELIDGN